MAAVTYQALKDLNVLCKLLAITADNASNNDTLVEHLHCQLLQQFDERDPDFNDDSRPTMQFRGKQSYIRCIAYVLNRIVQKILKDLKTRTAKEAKELKDIDIIGPLNSVVKIRLLVLWICKTP